MSAVAFSDFCAENADKEDYTRQTKNSRHSAAAGSVLQAGIHTVPAMPFCKCLCVGCHSLSHIFHNINIPRLKPNGARKRLFFDTKNKL
jgi:hypothetical protein